MCLYINMCVNIKICVFFIKTCVFVNKQNQSKQKNAADRPTDLGTDAARAVGWSVGGVFVCLFWFYLFISTHFLI